MADEQQAKPVPTPEHMEEFEDWLRHPPRNFAVSNPSKIEATKRPLQSYIDEHGRSRGGVISGRPAVWWKGLAIQDYGDYRLEYLGD